MADVVHITTVHDRRDPRIFERELNTIEKTGYSVALIAQGDDRAVENGVEIIPVGTSRGRVGRIALMRPAYRAAVDARPGLVHIHDPELILLARAIKRSTGARVVYDMHENYSTRGGVEGRLIRRLERWFARWGDAVVVVGDEHAEMVKEWGCDPVVLRNYFRPIEAQPATREMVRGQDGVATLLYTGVVDAIRGLDTLVECARLIDARDVDLRVRIVGVCYVSDERRALDEEFRENGKPGALSLEGWATFIPHDAILRACREADFGVCLWKPHANHTTIPTKFYEYLYYGLPIICTDLPHWADFIRRNECGTTVAAGNAPAVLEVAAMYRQNPALYRRHSEAARRVGASHSWESEEGKLIALYDRLIGPPARGGDVGAT